ncbi:unnamed protein product [Lepeophtheirus salmonis]|uniref:(salmon louse) hypothetical protein n=1 Tax=Lepeophtheirus salmonis TaxID=72036 RepID=A0A7R8CRP1_LEPSM|nr:unnamed protein product [Lepeophtheirus salmonis]CAF2905281.1 unnamed protein product [Lepeophtheirus salmonis]
MLRLYYYVILLFLGLSNARRFPDWLVDKVNNASQIVYLTDSNELLITNGLISRRFSFKANSFSTIEYYSHEKKSSLLRGIGPEAIVKLNGITFNQKPTPYPRRFTYTHYEIKDPQVPFPYSPRRGAPKDIVWPPMGKRLDVHFVRETVLVTVHYEIYDGIPLLVKWVSISSTRPTEYKLDGVVVEFLRLNMQWASPTMEVNVYSPHQGSKGYGWLDLETDEIHSSSMDCLDMNISLEKMSIFESFKVHELLVGSSDSERKGLARKRKVRLLAPHTQENPIFFHMTSFDSKAIRNVIDQMSEVGFEMLIYSFGSGFNLETSDLNVLKKIKADVSYANSKGIEIGGYDLIALSRHVGKDWMATPEEESACFASDWTNYLFNKIFNIISYTNMTMLETDGPYSGYSCNFIEAFSPWIYINQPDLYFYSGGSKTGMGYNEQQYSLPRWIDMSGWMFVPLEDYQGGGAAAAFEPLKAHAKEYEWALSQYLGAGVAACYRGTRLYDSPATKSIVQKWVRFYKKYRDILTSDTVQVRRGDMQSLDSLLHVNPFSKGIKGLAMVFNPTSERIQDELILPLYYTGIKDKVLVSLEGQEFRPYTLDWDFEIEVPIDLKPISVTWILIKDSSTI